MRTRLAAVTLGVLVVGLAACGRPASTTSTGTATTAGPSSTVAGPAPGQVTVSYGDAALSVPATWDVTLDGCDGPGPGVVQLGRLAQVAFCPAEPVGVDRVAILPLGATTVPDVAGHTINGIRVVAGEGSPGTAVTYAPGLGVEIETTGTAAQAALGTLSVSPRLVTLGAGATAVPPSWRSHTVDGLRLSVPAGWPIAHVGGTCAAVGFGSPALVEEEPGEPVPSCPPARGWVALDPDPFTDGVAVGPFSGPGAVNGPCLAVHGLKVCPLADPHPGVLDLSVARPGRPPSVTVRLGLGDGGAVARTVLHSLQPA